MEFKELQSILSTRSKVIIVTHKNPDGDAMGSSLGLWGVLQKKGCEVNVVAPTEYPTFLNWMKGNDEVLVWGQHNKIIKKAIAEADILFCLDFNALHRIDEVGELISKSEGKKVMIDHHQQPDDFVDYMISDTSASSTAEMVYQFIEDLGDDNLIDGDIGEALYCGIMTDTGSFRFPSTTHRTHEIAGKIIKKGAKHSMVHRRIYDSNTQRRLKVLGYCLTNMEVLDDYNVAIIKVSKEDHKIYNIQKGDTEGIVNYGLSLPHVKCSVFFREDENIVKISFRSKDDYNVNEFARNHFNGGGHNNAAGGMSKDSLEETLTRFKNIITSQNV
jgi:phosphoesterase RecJ-like protein